jgi:hypothetical protein
MAKIERSFHMDYAPDQAQALFLRDVGPAFAQDAEFLLQHEKPGELRFSEGDLPAGPGPSDETPMLSEQVIEAASPRRYQGPSTGISRAFAAHIKVEFTPEGDGTHVEITGHAEHELRDAIDRLGTPGHWPETANDPHS